MATQEAESTLRVALYDEWIRERKLAAMLVLGGQVRFDGWGRNPQFRVLGYGKSFERAIEVGLDTIGEKAPDFERKHGQFYGELTLELWTPSGPRSVRVGR